MSLSTCRHSFTSFWAWLTPSTFVKCSAIYNYSTEHCTSLKKDIISLKTPFLFHNKSGPWKFTFFLYKSHSSLDNITSVINVTLHKVFHNKIPFTITHHPFVYVSNSLTDINTSVITVTLLKDIVLFLHGTKPLPAPLYLFLYVFHPLCQP